MSQCPCPNLALKKPLVVNSPLGVNSPFILWGSCFLWLTSIFALIWSLMLFFSIGDMLIITGMDIINAIVLLSAIIMVPTNIHILCSVANGTRISHRSKVLGCPLWFCIIWIIVINIIGIILCAEKLSTCKRSTSYEIHNAMKHYRRIPKHKHFIDNLQWILKCCGLNSYRDWFNNDWYDKIRDYEWDPHQNKRRSRLTIHATVTDSVPLSCCKSGSCISNYLLELGTTSIYTRGCAVMLQSIIVYSMTTHIIMFLSVILVEILILFLIMKSPDSQASQALLQKKQPSRPCTDNFNVKHIMSVKDDFSASSASLQLNPDDSDEFERAERQFIPKHQNIGEIESYSDCMKKNIERPQSPNLKKAGQW